MKIDIQKIQSLSKDKRKRLEQGKNNLDIKSNMYPFSKELLSYIESLSTFEIASIILDKNNWISSRASKIATKTWSYRPGDIIMVYLGSGNYGYEPSYFHPAIVLTNFFDSVLIIPCSSTIPSHDRVVLADASDGFRNSSAILVDKLRVIDKKRIQRNSVGGVVGTLSKIKLNKVKDKVISLYLPDTEEHIDKLNKKIETMTIEKEQLKDKIEELENKILIQEKNENN